MSIEQSQHTMNRYFEAMGKGQFQQFFTDDVTWTTIESGEEVTGPAAVQAAIIALHSQLSDVHTRRLVVTDGAAYIEGDGRRAQGGEPGRISYCVAYDVDEDRITAMRAYGGLGAMTHKQSNDDTPV